MRSTLICTGCGATAAKWVGRCPACGAWGSLTSHDSSGDNARGTPVPLVSVDAAGAARFATGILELDLVLGGGLVPGSVTLLGGEPGIGKSTLLLQAVAAMEREGLFVCAEESAAQVRARAERLAAAIPPSLLVLAATSLPAIVEAIEVARPPICVVDSIQAIADPSSGAAAGSVSQVRDCAAALARVAKGTGTALVLVGHVTKDGALAGPRALEHLVDTVLSFEGDRYHALRQLAATKHRFGATGELGLFEMTDTGLVGVDDPSAWLLSDRRRGVPGSIVVPSVEGRRPIVAEVQALVATTSGAPRRSARGVDSARLAQILAVLERRVGLGLASADVFVSAVGGIRLTEPAADFGIAMALASAHLGVPLPERLVAFGEVGLAGELRQVSHAAARLAEAARLGFHQALAPTASPSPPAPLELRRFGTLDEAVEILRRRQAHPATRPLGAPPRPTLVPTG